MRETLLSYIHDLWNDRESTALMVRQGLRTLPWSYRQVIQKAFQVAEELASRRLCKGDRVILCAENSPEWVAVFFGCLLRGVIVVPLDAQSTSEFLSRVQHEIQAKCLLVGESRRDFVENSFLVESLQRFCRIVAKHPPNPDWSYTNKIGSDHVVEIMFTSGTTGIPKGVCLTHQNFLANLIPLETEIQKYLKWEPIVHPIRFLNVLPLSHVFGQLMGIFVPPMLKGQVLFLNSLNPSDIIGCIRRDRISVIATVPRILDILRDKIERDQTLMMKDSLQGNAELYWLRRWWTFRRIRRQFGWKFWAFVSGGATLRGDTEDFWQKLGYVVVQGYGMTETASIISVSHPFRRRQGSIGKTMPGQELKLGEGGEILVRGHNVSPGYWKDDGLPLTDQEGWLSTGDLGARDAQGNLFFRGRRNEVIVTGAGMNIYPGDIETVLNRQPEIRDSVVVGLTSQRGPEVVAVLLMRKCDADVSRAVQQTNDSLSPHQQIRRWMIWPGRDFPRTRTQKVRKQDVVAFVRKKMEGQAKYPENKEEGYLGEILYEINRITQVPPERRDRSANLTSDLKLDSLARVELIGALERKFQLDLDERRVTAALTLGDLEKLVFIASPDRMPESRPAVVETQIDREVVEALSCMGEEDLKREFHLTSPPSAQSFRPYPYPGWTLGFPATWIRWLVYHFFLWPLTRVLCWTRVHGQENLRGLNQPVLFMANHITFLDPAVILSCLPFHYRSQVATAMIGETLRDFRYQRPGGHWLSRFGGYLKYVLVTCLFNVFPLPRESGFRRSFDYAGEAMDRGYSVLVFPEGKLTQNGKLNPFQSGVGLLAIGLHAPVVPVKIEGLFELKRRRSTQVSWPLVWPGKISVTFGKPIVVDSSFSPEGLTRDLEKRFAQLSIKSL